MKKINCTCTADDTRVMLWFLSEHYRRANFDETPPNVLKLSPSNTSNLGGEPRSKSLYHRIYLGENLPQNKLYINIQIF